MTYRYNRERTRRAVIKRRWSWWPLGHVYYIYTWRARTTEKSIHWHSVYPMAASTLEEAQALMKGYLDNGKSVYVDMWVNQGKPVMGV